MPVRLLENLGAQPTLLPLFPGASKIADRLTGLHSLLRVGQPHGDPHAGLNTLMMDVGLAHGEYSGAGLSSRRAAGTRCGCREWGELVVLHAERVRSLETDELIAHYRRLVELADPDAAGIRRFLAEAMGRLTREGPGRRRGQEKQDAGRRLPAQL